MLLIADYLHGTDKFSHLCFRYGISRKTDYEWIDRYAETGVDGLAQRSSRRTTQAAGITYIVFSSDEQAGGGPAAAHFLCFAKESKQRKANARSRPLRGPQ